MIEMKTVEIWESGNMPEILVLKERLRNCDSAYRIVHRANNQESLDRYFRNHAGFSWHEKRYEYQGNIYLLEKEEGMGGEEKT